jgi:ATP-dependent Clp protease ATP-binding subunit ClpX
MDGTDLILTDDALDAVVARAKALGTGARGLRSVLEEVMLDLMFDAPDRGRLAACRLTAGVVEGREAPTYEERKATA